jgi:dTDP-4-dehydrorhamnose 3,5-epimerase
MTIEPIEDIKGVYVVTPALHGDERGWFQETYKSSVFSDAGITDPFVQDNHSRSAKGVLRGLHFQWEPPMGKLMRVTAGRAFLVAVDIRKNSPTIGKWFGIEANAENKLQVYAPAGFARGFLALEDKTEVQYKCTGEYNKEAESGIAYDDPAIGISWPVLDIAYIVSEKDAAAQTLDTWLARSEADHFVV